MKIMSTEGDGAFWMEQTGDEVLVGNGKSSEVLLRLKGDAAKRAFELLQRNEAGRGISEHGYNCHAAAEFIMFGRNADCIRAIDADMGIPVTQMSVRQAVETLELPCGFQLYSMVEYDDGSDGMYISHSAVLLGIAENGVSLAIEKDGRGPLRICSLETIRVDQKRTTMDKAYFYGTPRTLDAASCANS